MPQKYRPSSMVQYLKCKSLSVLPTFLVLTNLELKFYEKNLLRRLLILNCSVVVVFCLLGTGKEKRGQEERVPKQI